MNGKEAVSVSYLRRNRPDVLSNGASVLFPDIKRRELNVDHCGLNVCVSHELHQGWQTDTGPDHIGSEGVPKPMGVRLRDPRGLPVMTEQ
jgi:hypothetical protein